MSCLRSCLISKYLLTLVNRLKSSSFIWRLAGGRSAGSTNRRGHGNKRSGHHRDESSARRLMGYRVCGAGPPTDPHRPDDVRQNRYDGLFEWVRAVVRAAIGGEPGYLRRM